MEISPWNPRSANCARSAGSSPKHWTEILAMDLSNSVTDERSVVFLAWDLSETPAQPDETEQLQVARVPFREAVARVKRGKSATP